MKVHMYKKEISKICYERHLTVDEIFTTIKLKFPKVWKSTIYRNVEEMAENWELKKLKLKDSKNIYETNIWNHAHLICTKTWKIKDLNLENLNINWIPQNFLVDKIQINIYWEEI